MEQYDHALQQIGRVQQHIFLKFNSVGNPREQGGGPRTRHGRQTMHSSLHTKAAAIHCVLNRTELNYLKYMLQCPVIFNIPFCSIRCGIYRLFVT